MKGAAEAFVTSVSPPSSHITLLFGSKERRSLVGVGAKPRSSYNSITPPRSPFVTASARLVASNFVNRASIWNFTV